MLAERCRVLINEKEGLMEELKKANAELTELRSFKEKVSPLSQTGASVMLKRKKQKGNQKV